MQTLRGTAKHPGVAMAVAVVIDADGGLSGVPEQVMRLGLKAIKTGLPVEEHPEVVVVCHSLSIGSMVRIPGVRAIGIASQSSDESPLPLSVPCVVGLANLIRSVELEEIIIVDGDQGIVHIDPDVQTVVLYQSALSPEPPGRVFLESAHIPARTQDGRTIKVIGAVSSISEAETAISQGADALIVSIEELAAANSEGADIFRVLLALAAGKQMSIVLKKPDKNLKDIAVRFGKPGQVEFIKPLDQHKTLSKLKVRKAILSGASEVTIAAGKVAAMKELIRALPGEEAEDAGNG